MKTEKKRTRRDTRTVTTRSKTVKYPPEHMTFHVGPVPYTLVISDRSIFDEDGSELESVAVEDRRMLLISHIVEPARREELAMHEYVHAWEFFVPKPRNAEERAQLTAFMSQQFYKDLEAQGGREALIQMPMQRVNHIGRPALSELERIQRELLEAGEPLKRLETIASQLESLADQCGGARHASQQLKEPVRTTLPSPYAGVWYVCDYTDGIHVGYLATEPGNLDKPHAFLPVGGCDVQKSLAFAVAIVESPERAWRNKHDSDCVDLSYGGCAGTYVPMPSFVYSLRCTPLDETGVPELNVKPREPRPLCRFLCKQLEERLNQFAERMPLAK